MLSEVLEHLVKGIVENPEFIKIYNRSGRHTDILQVHVHPSDLGQVIGKRGRIAASLRIVMSALSSSKKNVRIDILEAIIS